MLLGPCAGMVVTQYTCTSYYTYAAGYQPVLLVLHACIAISTIGGSEVLVKRFTRRSSDSRLEVLHRGVGSTPSPKSKRERERESEQEPAR